MGMVRSHDPFFLKICPNHILEIGAARQLEFRVPTDTQEY